MFITHDLNEAVLLGDRILLLKDGLLVQVGTGPEILESPADDYVAEFVSDVDRSRVPAAADVIREPMALPSIMAGINQVIMLALSMVVVAGLPVPTAWGRSW